MRKKFRGNFLAIKFSRNYPRRFVIIVWGNSFLNSCFLLNSLNRIFLQHCGARWLSHFKNLHILGPFICYKFFEPVYLQNTGLFYTGCALWLVQKIAFFQTCFQHFKEFVNLFPVHPLCSPQREYICLPMETSRLLSRNKASPV
jgi:hypothetical protein